MPVTPSPEARSAADSEVAGGFERVPFPAARLRAGQPLQLRSEDEVRKERYLVKYIGFVDQKSVLVTAPLAEGRSVFVREGRRLVVHGFSGRHLYRFHASVLRACTQPYEYLHLSFPREVESREFRRAQRVEVELSAAFSPAGRALEAMPCLLSDISAGGASIQAERALGAQGEEARLSFSLPAGEGNAELTVGVVIRNVREPSAEGAAFAHGVEFVGLDPTQVLLLQNFVYRTLLDEP